jgi:GDP-L-fucose synthase
MADACVYLMNLSDEKFDVLLGSDDVQGGSLVSPLINIGVGQDLTIKELAETVKEVVGYEGDIVFDPTKPDGAPRKLLDVGRMHAMGWQARTSLVAGLTLAYRDFQRLER